MMHLSGGVLPGQASQPLGQITLPVQFGTADHFRVEFISFIIVDFEGTYHAILGRPALAKFMAVPHYVYLMLKMPTQHGVLSLRGNVLVAYNCERDSFDAVEAFELSTRMEQTIAEAKMIPPEEVEIPRNEPKRKVTKSGEHKEVELVPGDKSKMALIGAQLDPK
jgi:hypothetical protein